MDKILDFISKYRYPIIGFLFALIIVVTGLYRLIIPIAVIVLRNIWWFIFSEK